MVRCLSWEQLEYFISLLPGTGIHISYDIATDRLRMVTGITIEATNGTVHWLYSNETALWCVSNSF